MHSADGIAGKLRLLRKVHAYHSSSEEVVIEVIANARFLGASWEQVAATIGVSKGWAYKKYAARVNPLVVELQRQAQRTSR